MDYRRLSVLSLALSLVVACGSSEDPTTRRATPTSGSGGGGTIPAGAAGSFGGFSGTGGLVPPVGGGAGAAPAAGSGGTAGTTPQMGCGTVSQSSEVKRGEADIVWVIDGSGSMFDELAAVQQNISMFATSIGAAGIDHHVIMLAGADVAAQTPLGADPAHYLFVPSNVDSNNALQVLLQQYPQYSPFLRPGGTLHFVVVTDDESSMPAPDFQAQMEQTAGKKFVFHAIASEDVNGLACAGACGIPFACGAFRPGVQYYALADATGGQKVSICVTDWSMVFGPLQQAVIESAPLPCDYPIPPPPSGESADPGKVNVDFTSSSGTKTSLPRAQTGDSCGDELAFFYDDPATPKFIKMCPAACESIKAGGTIDIQLGCNTIVLN